VPRPNIPPGNAGPLAWKRPFVVSSPHVRKGYAMVHKSDAITYTHALETNVALTHVRATDTECRNPAEGACVPGMNGGSLYFLFTTEITTSAGYCLE